MRKYKVTLEKEEREELESIIQKGKHKSQKVLNALILLNSDQGRFQDHQMRNEDVSSVLRVRKILPYYLRHIKCDVTLASPPAQTPASRRTFC